VVGQDDEVGESDLSVTVGIALQVTGGFQECVQLIGGSAVGIEDIRDAVLREVWAGELDR
jgi:hypothetical protein